MNFRRIVIIDLASLGVGESSDANRYDSTGTDTLGHLDGKYSDQIQLPTLTALGLGNIRWDHNLQSIPEVDHPMGFAGKMHPSVVANYSTSTLREMFDFTEPLRTVSIFNALAREGYHVSIISRNISYLANQDVTNQIQCAFDDIAFNTAILQIRKKEKGLIYVQEPELQLAAINRDGEDYVKRLNIIDSQIKALIDELDQDDLLIITSSYAQDFIASKNRMTREYLPLVMYSKRFKEGHSLGIRRTVGDIATTIANNFSASVDNLQFNGSLLNQLP